MGESWFRLQVRAHEPFWCELTSGSAAVGWGLYAAFVGLSLDALPAYDVLTDHTPDWIWCWLSVALGAMQIFAALLEWRRFRQTMAFLMLVFWKVLAVSLFKSETGGPAAMVYCALAIGNIPTFWILFRSGSSLRSRL